jgi:hypothetical protein
MRRSLKFSTVRTEGGLLPTDLLARVVEADTSLPGVGAEAYHLGPGERINEAITRSWNRLTGAFAAFEDQLAQAPPSDKTATTLTRKWMQSVLQELGFGQVQTATAIEIDGRTYPVSHAWGHVAIHLVGARVALDTRTEGVAGAARVSPHGLVQELLNRSDDHLWAIVSNGRRLRLLRDHASLTRQAYVEFDLEGMFSGQVYADFVLLWLLCHESRFEGDPPEKCLLEQWVNDAAQRGTRALDDLRGNVETAITMLGQGFLAHPANAELRRRLRDGDLSTQDYYRQLLRLVYRLLFLSVAEARDLLLVPNADPTARLRYQRFYSLDHIRSIAESRRGANHPDHWLQLQIVVRALSSDAGEPLLALPALGSFLWSDRATPDLDDAQLANRHFLDAVRALSRIEDGKVTRSIDYRNLGSEELGSVYESLLELHPELHPDTGAFTLTTAGGHERKTTGSYYTPTSLINELLDSALEPVLAEAVAADDPEAAILALTVLDPACGSGHFLIAAAQRIATRLAAVRTGDGEPSPEALRTALRDVVGRCLYGIDVNPMAVELCKVSLWMEAVEPGKPLGFLDHHIVCGNGLLGATPALLERGVPDEAFKALIGDDKAVVSAWKKANKRERSGQGTLDLTVSPADLARPLAEGIAAIDAIASDDATRVHEQERGFVELQSSEVSARAKLHADAWCAAFVAPKTKGAPVITDAVIRRIATDPSTIETEVVTTINGLAEQFDFLHLHLAFPTVFHPRAFISADDPCGWEGGFSVVLGNPPWDKVKLSEKEFFAARAPDIARAAGAARSRLIDRLEAEDPALWSEYRSALRRSEGAGAFLRSSGRFPLCGRGDVNTYAVFAESMRDVLTPSGRVGVIVPTGIATDDTTRFFFGDCIARDSLVSLFDFENAVGLFPGVGHGRMKFCLLTLAGLERRVRTVEFAFFAHYPVDLHDPDRRFTLSPQDLALIKPNTRTAPVFRSRRDAELSATIYSRVPVLTRDGDQGGNPWGAYYLRLVHYDDHARLLETIPATDRVRVYEAKMIHQFEHRWGDWADRSPSSQANDLPTVPEGRLADPSYIVQPRYWIRAAAFEEIIDKYDYERGWLLAYRDVVRATDVRTAIVAAIPYGPASVNVPILGTRAPESPSVLLAVLNSFGFDYLARQGVGGMHLQYGVLKQLPVPGPAEFARIAEWDPSTTVASWLSARISELVYTAWDLEAFGRELGRERPFRWDAVRREALRAELDAACFHLYGVERDDADYIMETFPIVKRKDVAAHGEFRTKRLILEVCDAMTKAIETGEPYRTILDPPPADPSCAHPESTRPEWAREM